MNISHDGTIVSFKTEPKELFLAEKSGAKSNIVCILDKDEYQQLRKADPKKIIIQYEQEVFLRTKTNLYVIEDVFGKVIFIFNWQGTEKYNPFKHISGIDKQLNSTPTPAEDDPSEPSPTDDAFTVVTISRNLHRLLQSITHGRSLNSVIQELYEASQYQQFKAEAAEDGCRM